MDVAVLVLAMISLVVSGVAVWYTRRTTFAAERNADADPRAADASERANELQEEQTLAAGLARVEPIQWGAANPI